MKTLKSQRGMTMWGVLGGVFIAIVIMWLGIKVAPEYMEASTIQKCLGDSQMGAGKNLPETQKRFGACLDVNGIREGFDPKSIVAQGSGVKLEWAKQLPIAGNASLLLEFTAEAPKL